MSTAVSQIDLTGVPAMALSQLAPRRAGEAGGDNKWEVTLHPSWHDKDKILSPEECLHKLKGKQILSKSPEISRSSLLKEGPAQPGCTGTTNSIKIFTHISG